MAHDFPVGVSLGVDYFTSAYIDHMDNVVTVASIEASQSWKDFFLDTMRGERDRSEQKEYILGNGVKDLIASSLASIRQATEEKLGRPVEINALSYPEHFRNQPYVTSVAYTALEVYPGIKDVMQVTGYLNAIRIAYSLNTPEGFGYEPDVDLSLLNSLLLHLDYQKDFLEVSLMSVDKDCNIRDRVFRIDGFGGKENIASSEELSTFKTQFQDLVTAELQELRGKSYLSQISDFNYIISSGTVSSSEFRKLQTAITEIVPEFSTRFHDEIDPFWVAAVGIAKCAKAWAIDPPVAHFDMPHFEEGDPPIYDAVGGPLWYGPLPYW